MTKKMFIAAGLAAVLGSVSVAVSAQPPAREPGMERRDHGPEHDRRGPRGGSLGRFGLPRLELTEAQREQVQAIVDSHQTALREAGTRLRDAQRAFAAAGAADPLDEAAIRTQSTAVAAAMADHAILNAKVRQEIVGTLTPEQQQQISEQRGKRRPPQ